MKKFLLILITVSTLIACNKEVNYPEVQSTSTMEYIVASNKIYAQTSDPCTGTTFTMEAYAVKESTDENWEPFFSQIKGFEYSQGVEYVINAKKERLYDPRMSVQYWDEYTLTKIISEQQKESENIPLSKNAPCIDVYIDGDELTDKELSDLRESIIKDAFVGISWKDGAHKIELFYYDSLTNISSSDTYSVTRSPKEEELTEEQRASIAWTQDIDIKGWMLLTSSEYITALYYTTTYTQTKSSSEPPVFMHLDITAKYKTAYPNLKRAYSVHQLFN